MHRPTRAFLSPVGSQRFFAAFAANSPRSKLKGREAHSVTCFLPFRERYNHLFEDCFQNIFIDPRKSSSGIQFAKELLASRDIDLEEILHQAAIEMMTACLCRVGEAMPTKDQGAYAETLSRRFVLLLHP